MKIGVSTASFFPREECENAIEIIKGLGADCAEVFLGSFYEYRPEFAKANRERFGGIEISSVHSSSVNFEPQLFASSRRVRGDGFYWLDQFLRSAVLLGAKKYSFHGYISRSTHIDFDRISERLLDICEFSSRYGVDICLENVSWCTYNRPGLFREFKSRCPQLAAVLDIKQARRSGYPVNMYIEDMAGSISHVHLSDVTESGKMCLPISMLSVNASTSAPDGAKDFVKFALSDYLNDCDYLYGTPINRDALLKMEENPERDEQGNPSYEPYVFHAFSSNLDDHRIDFAIGWCKPEVYERYNAVLDSLDSVNLCESMLLDTLLEEGPRALSGERSIEETVNAIEKKVQLYLAE